jgi:hypothetical protein
MNSKFLHSGNLIIAGFGMMIIFMSYLVFRCMTQPAEMVNDNYYENELKYQENIIAKSNGDEYKDGYQITKVGNEVKLNLPKELTSKFDKASINFYCISDKTFDTKVVLKQSNEGVYTFDCSKWKNVSYTVKISIEKDGKTYYHELPLQL